MKIEGYKVRSVPARGQGSCPSWLVMDESGEIVAGIHIHYSYNSAGAYCCNYYSRWTVTAVGPAFYEARKPLDEAGVPGYDVYPKAISAAEKVGQHLRVQGSSSNKADAMSQARKVVREQAFPWLKKVLGVEEAA